MNNSKVTILSIIFMLDIFFQKMFLTSLRTMFYQIDNLHNITYAVGIFNVFENEKLYG